MRASAILPTFGVAIATALTVGCSAGAAVTPEVAASQNGGRFALARTEDGKLYYDDIDSLGNGSLWSVSCPAGACGVQTQVAGITFGNFPAGIKFDTSGDLLVNDAAALTADTFELPNPKPKTFPLSGVPVGLAVDPLKNHWFVADPTNNVGVEYLYPSGVLVGTVPGNPSGALTDIAVDP